MTTTDGRLPIIDVSPLLGGERLESGGVTEAIHDACVDNGFFVLVGHGLDAELGAIFEASRAFFSLSQVEKELVPRNDRYGYVPQRDQALDRVRPGGLTEYLDMGLADEVALPEIQGFGSAVRSYQEAALGVGEVVLGALAVALGAERTFFASVMTQPQCRLRLLHYAPMAILEDGTLPVSNTSHTDYGLITLLATDGIPGLEVRSLDGDWVPVEAPDASLIVNLGDMLARWTNDRYRSTPHRVVGSPDRDRFSIPFFINPDPSTMVECMPSCVTPQRPRRYEAVTAGDFLASRIDSTTEPYVDPRDGPRRSVS